MDEFKSQAAVLVNTKLDELNIEYVLVPKHMSHLLQLEDLATNDAMKQMENRAFSDYFTDCILRKLLKDLGKDITTVDVNLKHYASDIRCQSKEKYFRAGKQLALQRPLERVLLG